MSSTVTAGRWLLQLLISCITFCDAKVPLRETLNTSMFTNCRFPWMSAAAKHLKCNSVFVFCVSLKGLSSQPMLSLLTHFYSYLPPSSPHTDFHLNIAFSSSGKLLLFILYIFIILTVKRKIYQSCRPRTFFRAILLM